MEKNILLKIAYDGSNFSGWQKQVDKRTVCGVLEDLISALLGEKIKLNGCSRTDAGVHANMQCASFTTNTNIPGKNIAFVINNALIENKMLGVSDIRILSSEEVPSDFHARFSSKGKRYIYKIKTTKNISVFDRNYYYQISKDLDIENMKKASRLFIGEKNFAAFQSSGSPKESTVRTIYDIDIKHHDDEIDITVSGNGFLYNMVRIIVGTLVEVGLGKRDIESINIALESLDRQDAGFVAPAEGLYLDEVFF